MKCSCGYPAASKQDLSDHIEYMTSVHLVDDPEDHTEVEE
jgi:hypothetical protein